MQYEHVVFIHGMPAVTDLCPKLGLGTVQWGLSYGIANQTGRRPGDVEVGRMIRLADRAGVRLLDTARGYGESESVIGRHADAVRAWHVVTKTARGGESEPALTETFGCSLANLGTARVYGLLAHHPDDLLADRGRQLWDQLQDFKSRGMAAKIGVSVYDPQQLDRILIRYPVDLVQLPFNLYDQRFLRTGWLKQLRLAGIEVHARSSFLQGLLLMPPDRLPGQFSAWSGHHQSLHRTFAEAGVTPLAGCLRFCLEQSHIDRVIVGCESADQLGEILHAGAAGHFALPDAGGFAVDDGTLIDPRRWSRQS